RACCHALQNGPSSNWWRRRSGEPDNALDHGPPANHARWYPIAPTPRTRRAVAASSAPFAVSAGGSATGPPPASTAVPFRRLPPSGGACATAPPRRSVRSRARPGLARSPALSAWFLRRSCGWKRVLAVHAPLPGRLPSACAGAISAPSARSPPSPRPPCAASPACRALASTNPTNLVPLDSLRFVPFFSLAAVNRNFLLWPNRNFSLWRDTFITNLLTRAT